MTALRDTLFTLAVLAACACAGFAVGVIFAAATCGH